MPETTTSSTPEPSPLLARLRRDEPTLMLAIRSARTTEIVRIAHSTGHHVIMVDLEHSHIDVSIAAEMCGAAGDLGLSSFVRIPERDYGIIGRLLDGGATGIIAPRIETAAQAEEVARACRFPPHGQRSQLAMVPQFGMRPMPPRDLNARLDAQTVVQALVETPAGSAAADAIAALPGVDILAIGANDLSAELGIAGDYANPSMRDAVAVVGAACKRHGKLMMLGGVGDLELMRQWMPLGIAPLFMTGTDTDMLYGAAEARTRKFLDWYKSF